MHFQYEVPSKVVFGTGTVKQLGTIVTENEMEKVLLVYDQGVKDAKIVDQIIDILNEANITFVEFSNVVPNPPDTILEEGANSAKAGNVDGIVAIGGGSSIDAAKAINILITNTSPINQYDGINNVKNPTKPLIAIPTTSGTGSEVTTVTVITDTVKKRKMVIGGKYCGADIALVDPGLTVGLPPAITAATGMDALTHALESYISKFASVATDVNGLKAIELITNNIECAYEDGTDMEARENMLLASMLAGFAFNSAFLGVVHAIAHPLSVYCGLPHGVANACTLPSSLAFNAEDPHVQKRLIEPAKAMGIEVTNLSAAEATEQLVEKVTDLSRKLDIPSLSELGVKKDQFDILAQAAMEEEVSVMANPRELTKEDILSILEASF